MFLELLQWLFLLLISVCSSLLQADYLQCNPWSFYNDTSLVCQCYETQTLPTFRTHHDFILECSERRVLMNAEYCLTNEVDGTLNFVGRCSTYLINKNVIMVDGIYIQLPDNISQLNDYMCGPMNRKGRICSECIDGFAPSFTSFGYECSNCTGSWYGIPLYLFLEFVPITIFYLAVLVFQISITSSPMTFCVFYSQAVCYMVTQIPFLMFFKSSYTYTVVKILTVLHGIWNLDFFRYVLPPFCVSSSLKNIHILFLGYISAAYPLLLIVLTLILIELYSRNLQPFVWLWNKLSCLKANRDSKTTIIDIFATFFFLSYTKLCFISLIIFGQADIHKANRTQSYAVLLIDPSIRYFSKEHIPYAVIGGLILLIFGLLPALLLAAYPIRKLRSLLLIDHLGGRSNAALNIFVEKFYSCYRDGLDGGRDMRSFASMHLFIRLLAIPLTTWISPTFFFVICCLLIVAVRPCKQSYMNYTDAFILAFLAINSYQIDKITNNSKYSPLYLWSLLGTGYLPLFIIYGNLIPKKLLMKLKKKAAKLPICKKFIRHLKDEDMQDEEPSDNSILDDNRMMQPHQYQGGVENGSSESDALLNDPKCALNPVYS